MNQPERYVTLNLTRAQGSAVPLAVEIKRFHSILEENRRCQLCDLGKIENKIHFVSAAIGSSAL